MKMNRKILGLSAVLVGACLIAASAAPALSATELCPMGGAMVVVATDKEKALAWAADQSKKDVGGADTADWSVLTLSRTNKEIAIRLAISEKTVKAHLTRTFRQIGVNDRVQAALWARDNWLGATPRQTRADTPAPPPA